MYVTNFKMKYILGCLDKFELYKFKDLCTNLNKKNFHKNTYDLYIHLHTNFYKIFKFFYTICILMFDKHFDLIYIIY